MDDKDTTTNEGIDNQGKLVEVFKQPTAIVLMLVIIGTLYMTWLVYGQQISTFLKQNSGTNVEIPTEKKNSKAIHRDITLKPTAVPDYYTDTVRLVRNLPDGSQETLLTRYNWESVHATKIFNWGDYLFYNEIHDKQYNQSLYAYNLLTHEKIQLPEYVDEQGVRTLFISPMLINNTLYFSGGNGGLFYIEYPPSEAPKKIESESRLDYFSTMYEINGQYIASLGYGDSCGGYEDYYMLDIETKQLSKFFGTNSGCVEAADTILGFTNDGKAIVAHMEQRGDEPDEIFNFVFPNLVNIYRMNIPDVENYEVLLTEQDMPKNIQQDARYEPVTNVVVMDDEELFYLYDLDTDKVKQLNVDFKPSSAYIIYGIDGNTFCLGLLDQGINFGSEYLVNIETNDVTQVVGRCQYYQDYVVQSVVADQEPLPDQIEALNLPVEYELIFAQ